MNTEGLRHAYECIGRVRREFRGMAADVLRRHGAAVERNAAPLTPVDMGFLRRATKYDVTETSDGITLTIANRMAYARYQHETEGLRHKVGGPHFIRDPLRAEIPEIKRDISSRIEEMLIE